MAILETLKPVTTSRLATKICCRNTPTLMRSSLKPRSDQKRARFAVDVACQPRRTPGKLRLASTAD